MSEVFYLFDPKHPRRASQVLQRLWVEDKTLLVEQGSFSGWALIERREFDLPQAARSALTKRLADAHARGLVSETDDIAVIARLSARHAELEAALAEVAELDSAEGRELLQVYADYLQSEGDPRGLLASMQLRNLDTRAWFAEHMPWCFGRFAPLVRHKKNRAKPISLRWFGGWVTDLCIDRGRGRYSDAPSLASVLNLPACAGVRRLVVPMQRLPEDPELPCRTSLRELTVDGSSFGELPRLEHLTLIHDLSSVELVAPNLRSLKLFGTAAGIERLLESFADRRIERLAWHFPSFDHDADALRELFEHPALGSLRELSIEQYDDFGRRSDEWLTALCEAPLLHRLELREFTGLVLRRDRLLAPFAAAPGRTVVNG